MFLLPFLYLFFIDFVDFNFTVPTGNGLHTGNKRGDLARMADEKLGRLKLIMGLALKNLYNYAIAL